MKTTVRIYGSGGGYYDQFDVVLQNITDQGTAVVVLPGFDFPVELYKTANGWVNWFGFELQA